MPVSIALISRCKGFKMEYVWSMRSKTPWILHILTCIIHEVCVPTLLHSFSHVLLSKSQFSGGPQISFTHVSCRFSSPFTGLLLCVLLKATCMRYHTHLKCSDPNIRYYVAQSWCTNEQATQNDSDFTINDCTQSKAHIKLCSVET